jgi:hypothetical protein
MGFDLTVIGRVRQCPRCELRFSNAWELEDHMANEHHIERLSHVFLKDLESPFIH